jgi:hypothetical protein
LVSVVIHADRPRSERERYIIVTADEIGDLSIDEVAVERAVNGDRPAGMTTAERAYAARLLDAHGASVPRIAAMVGANELTIRTWEVNGWDPNGTLVYTPPKRELIKCGTVQGYRKHLRWRNTPCQPCRDANAAADRAYRFNGTQKAADLPMAG